METFRPEPPPLQCNSTLITAYYKIESKHTFEEYLSWMINFLTLKDCMVVFVQPDLVETISSLRPPAYPILVIPRPWDSFLVNRILTPEQWMYQEAKGINGSIGCFIFIFLIITIFIIELTLLPEMQIFRLYYLPAPKLT